MINTKCIHYKNLLRCNYLCGLMIQEFVCETLEYEVECKTNPISTDYIWTKIAYSILRGPLLSAVQRRRPL